MKIFKILLTLSLNSFTKFHFSKKKLEKMPEIKNVKKSETNCRKFPKTSTKFQKNLQTVKTSFVMIP